MIYTYRKLLMWAILTTLYTTTVYSQREQAHHIELTKKDGMPSTNISSGFEDSKGMIRFISAAGEACKFDGFTVTTVPVFRAGLSCINFFEDSDGLLWIVFFDYTAKKRQIKLLDPITQKVYEPSAYWGEKPPFHTDNIKEVCHNYDGSVWIVLKTLEVYEYTDRKFKLWATYDKNKVDNVYAKVSPTTAYCRDKKGAIFVDNKGVFLPKPYNDQGYSNFKIWDIKKQANQRIQLVVRGTRLSNGKDYLFSVLDNKELRLLDSLTYIPNKLNFYLNGYSSIKREGTNKLTLYSKYYKPLYSIPLHEDESLLLTDSKGGIWVSKTDGTMTRHFMKEPLFDIFDFSYSMDPWQTSARGITTGPENDLYISKGGFLTRTTSDGRSTLLRPKPTPLNRYFEPFGCIMQQDNLSLWIGGQYNLYEFDIKNSEFKKPIKNVSEDVILQPYQDRNGKIWLGTGKGLYYLASNAMKIIETDLEFATINTSQVFSFYENKKGLWIATSSGLFLLQHGKIVHQCVHLCSQTGHTPHQVITSIQEDENGWFWLSTKGGGLIYWNPTTEEHYQYSTQNGLSDNVIYGCYLDDYNRVWMSSNNGLMQLDRSTKEVVYFSKQGGVPDKEFNTTSHFKDKNGRLYFGGLQGVIGFHPKDFTTITSTKNTIQITSIIKIDKNDFAYFEKYSFDRDALNVNVSTQDKEVTLSFSSLNLNEIESTLYSYKLNDINSKWRLLKEPKINLKELPYGDHTLLLRAQISGESSEIYPYTITVTVLRPFYLKWWFFVLMACLLGLLARSAVLFRTKKLHSYNVALEKIVKERTAKITEQGEKLKEVDQVKTRFLENVSHELRTPATLIMAPLNDLKSKIKGTPIQPILTKNIDIIGRNAQSMLNLIEELLDLSKLTANTIKTKEVPINLKKFISRTKSTFESNAALKNITFRLDYQLSNKKVLLIDPPTFEKILNNYISNALKFTPKDGEILIQVTEKINTILISVKDSGIGIDDKELPYIFDRFYQSKTQGRGMYGGTGIGLAICKEMASLLQGVVWAESLLGQGSTFYFEFPMKQGVISPRKDLDEGKSVPYITSSKPKTQQKPTTFTTILLVEDNTDMSDFITSILADTYTVILAKNGLEGLEMLQQENTIELILSDVMMPLMDGFTMLERIKENPIWRSLPMIMLTAKAAKNDRIQAFTLGVDDYIMKPFSNEELLVRIENLLNNYKNRKIWNQDLIRVSRNATSNKSPLSEEPAEEVILPSVTLQDLKWMKQVENVIHIGISNENFNVETLAKELAISNRQFSRKIKIITGLSPAKLVLEVRLSKAREYLEKGTYRNISEVCFAVGLENPSYFAKLYKNRFGRECKSYFK
jgi:signal transduction histidine kinase/DNA-binding response OmpR family regulator/ligand-binding sensor domain-containing protein